MVRISAHAIRRLKAATFLAPLGALVGAEDRTGGLPLILVLVGRSLADKVRFAGRPGKLAAYSSVVRARLGVLGQPLRTGIRRLAA